MAHNIRLRFDGSFFLLLAVALLILPLRLSLAWCLAVAVHEAGHYAALRLLRVQVSGISFSSFGIRMETGYLSARTELVCAISGPIAGLSLLFLAKYIPYTAFCALLHSIFNFLPVYPTDGGRILRILLTALLKSEKIAFRAEKGIFLFVIVGSLLAALRFRLGFGVLIGIFLIFAQNILANRGN